MKGLILYATYETIENKTYIYLFGRLENKQSFLAIKDFSPYFYVKKIDVKKLPNSIKKENISETSLRNFNRESVAKISFSTKKEMSETLEKINKKMETYEADIRPYYRFLMDNKIFNTIEIEGEYAPSEKIDRIYKEPDIKPTDCKLALKIASIDIETDKKSDKLFCIGLVSENYKKNFIISKQQLKNAVSCKSEEECLEKFKSELIKLDPDIITGWNIIDFDFICLQKLFRKHRVKFDIGRTDQEASLRIEKNFFRASTMNIPGRQTLDALNLIKDPFLKDSPFIKNINFESYTLENVSQAILKKGKIISGENRHDEIEELYKTNSQASLQKLVDYNLTDCELVLEILEKTKMLDLALERTQLTGLQLDRLTASIAAFDSLYIREAAKKKIVSPTAIFKKKERRIEGGYVESQNPGVYKNVLVLDFKSLYPSIIRTFNIDPASFLEKPEKGCIKAPNNACFKNQEGVLPIIIERLHQAREKAKKENRQLSSHAIKIIMNSFFGVLASPNCRYFNLDIANAITHFGQFIIKLTAKEIEKSGYKVIYSDTDSVFVVSGLDSNKALSAGKNIESDINDFYKKYVKENYSRESFLELEFEKLYLSLMIPKTRGQEVGAKKRYAGLIEKNGKEELEITGLEAIRGDWTEAAQEFQIELLKKLFHDEPIEKFIKEYIKKIRDGKLDDKLIYRKSIRKSLEEYTKTTPPHVKAARQLTHLESNRIEYLITTEGPEPIQKLKHKLNYEHYIEKQIKPIANQILPLFNKIFEDLSQNSKQTKLF